jgi:soluble lytic murein transglycosylase-like protein
MGLFQVMPFHFNQGEDTFDPQNNALRGINYLKESLSAHAGDARSALAGYNAGITGSKRPEAAWPSETIRYVYWGYNIYMDALAGKDSSAVLQEWLQAGGSGLCDTARARQIQ